MGFILLKNEKCACFVNIEQLRPLTTEIYYNILGKCDCLRNMAVDLGSLFDPRISEVRYIIYIQEIDSRHNCGGEGNCSAAGKTYCVCCGRYRNMRCTSNKGQKLIMRMY